MRYEQSDHGWDVINPMLPNKPRGIPRVEDRRVLNGTASFGSCAPAAPCRDLPEPFVPGSTCYNRFVRWRRAGVWDRIMDALAAGHDAAVAPVVMGHGVRRDDGGGCRDGGDLLVESMKMVDRPMAVADAEAIGRRDRGADPGLGVAHRGFHVFALRKAGGDG